MPSLAAPYVHDPHQVVSRVLGEFLSILAFLKGSVQLRAADRLRRELGVGCSKVGQHSGLCVVSLRIRKVYEYFIRWAAYS